MKKSNWQLTQYLSLYVGFIQLVHFTLLCVSGYHYIKYNTIELLAPPPAQGWSQQAIYFLLGCGIIDAILVLFTLYFVYMYLFLGVLKRTLGITLFSGSTITALIFGIGTLPSGAWSFHPLSYWIMVGLFVPFIVLLFKIWRSE
ncbi:MAG: hypothetical protein HQ509_05445 [Candidatus Marinimicrobia bacterium]|nr:hypothetical protein [Candidatus Neomarinimicrobiota bacterium]